MTRSTHSGMTRTAKRGTYRSTAMVNRQDFERSLEDRSNLDPRARQIAVFSLRAVLNVGMLLPTVTVAH